MASDQSSILVDWRGPFTNREVNQLHAEAFETRVFSVSEWDWNELVVRHSLGWVTARTNGALAGLIHLT